MNGIDAVAVALG